MEVYLSYHSLLVSLRKIPKHKMEGTQSPTNKACSLLPVNHMISEKTRERSAATNNRMSPLVNFLNIDFKFLL